MSLAAIQPFLILPILYLTRGINFDEGDRLLYLRVAFGVVHVAIILVTLWLKTRIDASTKATVVRVPAPKTPFSTEEAAPAREMTEKEYDLEQWQSLLKNTVVQLAILGAIHYKWAVTVPLLSQIILSPIKLWTSELFQSYVLGTPIERPFPVPKSPFADLMAGFMGGGTEDAAAADKKAKKAAKKGNATKIAAPAAPAASLTKREGKRAVDDID